MSIPSPPPRNPQRYHPHTSYNLTTQMARLHGARLGRAHSHEGVTSTSSVADIYFQAPDEDGKYFIPFEFFIKS